MSRRPAVIVVGSGRLGGALARALRRAGVEVRRAGRTRPLPHDTWQLASHVFLAVPDDAVPDVARRLAPWLGPRTAVVHCAGALSLEALSAARPRPVGSLHPLCAISSPRDTLAGHWAAVAASSETLRRELRGLARAVGLHPLHVRESRRAAYHAGAVLAAGGVVSLLSAAGALWRDAGLRPEDARDALVDLASSALGGVARRGFSEGLTGPIVRGDTAVVARHLRALPERLRPLYAALASQALVLAGPRLASARRRRLRALLSARSG